jgi:AcrR family transcriptional regulator
MDSTKEKIINAAIEIFIERGYSGSSISQIAKKANINQSLIYHHFKNKHDLWLEVKKSSVIKIENDEFLNLNFSGFVEKIVDARVEFYEENPHVFRLIQWQALEDEEDLSSKGSNSPLSWIKTIQNLQNNLLVAKDYSAELIAIYIHSLINGLLFDFFKHFKGNKIAKDEYIKMIKEKTISSFEYK